MIILSRPPLSLPPPFTPPIPAEHLRLSRLKSLSVNEDERGYRLVVLRPPKGPEGNSKGFLHYVRRQWTGPPLNQPQMMASAGGSGVTVVTPSPSASSLLPPSSSSSYTSAAGGQSSPSPANTPPKKTCKSRLYLHIWMFIHEFFFLGLFPRDGTLSNTAWCTHSDGDIFMAFTSGHHSLY